MVHGRGVWRVVVGVALTAVVGTGCKIEPRTDRAATGQRAVQAPAAAVVTKRVIQVPGVAPSPVYSPAVRSGPYVFLAGQIGAPPGGEVRLVEGGVAAETGQALENLRAALAAAGGTMSDMVKCTVFLADIADYAAMNEVYVTFFPSDPPARSAFATSGLPFDARVEIECIAAAR